MPLTDAQRCERKARRSDAALLENDGHLNPDVPTLAVQRQQGCLDGHVVRMPAAPGSGRNPAKKKRVKEKAKKLTKPMTFASPHTPPRGVERDEKYMNLSRSARASIGGRAPCGRLFDGSKFSPRKIDRSVRTASVEVTDPGGQAGNLYLLTELFEGALYKPSLGSEISLTASQKREAILQGRLTTNSQHVAGPKFITRGSIKAARDVLRSGSQDAAMGGTAAQYAGDLGLPMMEEQPHQGWVWAHIFAYIVGGDLSVNNLMAASHSCNAAEAAMTAGLIKAMEESGAPMGACSLKVSSDLLKVKGQVHGQDQYIKDIAHRQIYEYSFGPGQIVRFSLSPLNLNKLSHANAQDWFYQIFRRVMHKQAIFSAEGQRSIALMFARPVDQDPEQELVAEGGVYRDAADVEAGDAEESVQDGMEIEGVPQAAALIV